MSYKFSKRKINRTPPDGALEITMNDIHLPKHFAPGWDVVLQVIKRLKPWMVYLNGDVVDNTAVSKHTKKITDRALFKHDLRMANRELKRLRTAAPNSLIAFREGNHDEWLS